MINKLREDISEEKDNGAILREVYPELIRFCRFLTQNNWDGDDLAQETILKAMQGYGKKTVITTALLKTIARHSWIDTIRKRKKRIFRRSVGHRTTGGQLGEISLKRLNI
ncbi:sigma factor [Peribacillus frigoritolerans]|nr:sigma factor [Peribacillus frigoritolerans]